MAGIFRYRFGTDYDGVGDGDVFESFGDTFSGRANISGPGIGVGALYAPPELIGIRVFTNGLQDDRSGYLGHPGNGVQAFTNNAGYLFDWTGEALAIELAGGNFGDWLFGGTSADSLHGGGGNDLMRGDAGDDTVDGGAGTQDTARFSGLVDDYGISFTGSSATVTDLRPGSPDGTDTLTDVEILAFADAVFALASLNVATFTQGGATGQFLTGGEGFADVINGGDGGDFIQGLSGDDQLNGETGDDVLYGGAGNDLMAGGFGNDVLIGGEGQDQMHGEAGSDQLFGGGGQDDLRGGDGADFLSGGEGAFDFLSGGAGGDRFIITDTPTGTKEGTVDALILDFSFAQGDRLDLGGVPGGGGGALFAASHGFGFGPSTLVTLANGTQFVMVGQGVSEVQANFGTWLV
jgi:Ca2+-binding RTX toxin-like protein